MEIEQFYNLEATNLRGQPTPMSTYKGKVLLIVNVASQCGFTPQYEGLGQLREKYNAKGLEVLGFPCNQFGAQEPGDSVEIQSFCDINYKVRFPLFQKVDVNGPDTHPIYVYLKKNKRGLLGTELIKWNFTKFLVDKEGGVVGRYSPQTLPKDLEADIEKLL